MRHVSGFIAALTLVCLATTASATIYPPGDGSFPDTLTIEHIQNPAAVPHPVNPDSVLGIRGIITAFDTFPSGFSFNIQNSQGGPWTGLLVFSGGLNLGPPAFNLGDSVAVYGQVNEFNGLTQLVSFAGSFGNDIIVGKISSGNPLPPFHDGTVAELHELPTNPNAEQYEGGLVKIADPLRVVRNNFSGGIGLGFRWMMVVDNTVCPPGSGGPCDSLFIDTSTLANPAIDPPAVGAVIDSVQGIYSQATRGYRIQIRDGNDQFVATPPNLARAYIIDDNSIKVVFDRDVTQASAEDLGNYSLASFSPINAATQASGSTVILEYSDGLPAVSLETLTVNGVVSLSSDLPMTTPQNATFWNKVNDIKTLQAPDPTFLSATPPCEDRSRFAGTGAGPGELVTWRCVATADFGGLDYMQDENGGLRSGMSVFAASAPMVPGRKYLVVGSIQEFFNETEAIQTVEVIDEGVGTIPAPISEDPLGSGIKLSVFATRDTTCDDAQNFITGEDLEGTLVKLWYVKAFAGSPFPSAFFDVSGGPQPTNSDTINVDNEANDGPDDWTFQPQVDEVIDVTGVIRFSFGEFVISPRTDADFVSHGINVSVGDPVPARITFALSPNPATASKVSFGLPKAADVDLAVFDVAGRKVATLAKGAFDAGTYSRDWTGVSDAGKRLGAGVYFIRLNVGGENFTTRSVLLD
jgi:hypothetical protein